MKIKIEIPAGSTDKYEEDKRSGKMVIDRKLSIPCPHCYGYVIGTLAEDSDPLDVFLITDKKHNPGDIVEASVYGMIDMIDGDERDNKIIASSGLIPELQIIEGIDKIYFYLENYKEVDEVDVGPFLDSDKAFQYIEFCRNRYEQ